MHYKNEIGQLHSEYMTSKTGAERLRPSLLRDSIKMETDRAS